MNIEDITIGEARQIAAMFGTLQGGAAPAAPHPYIGQYVVVRSYAAGVHVGTLKSVTDTLGGREVILADARRIHTWSGAFTLSAVASEGITGGNMSVAVPEISVSQAIELIPCSAVAKACLTQYKVHKP